MPVYAYWNGGRKRVRYAEVFFLALAALGIFISMLIAVILEPWAMWVLCFLVLVHLYIFIFEDMSNAEEAEADEAEGDRDLKSKDEE